jgi:hypothetical protein
MMQRKPMQYHTGIVWLATERGMNVMNTVPEICPASGTCR